MDVIPSEVNRLSDERHHPKQVIRPGWPGEPDLFSPPEAERHEDREQTGNRHPHQAIEIHRLGVGNLPEHLKITEGGDAARRHREDDDQDPGTEGGQAQDEGKRQGG